MAQVAPDDEGHDPRPAAGRKRSPQRSAQRSASHIHIVTAANRYEMDLTRKPPGMDYGWKVRTVLGQENTEALVMQDLNGWVPVPPDRHPELSGRRIKTGQTIERGGLVLCERPMELTEESREMERFAAGNQMASQIARLGLDSKTNARKGRPVRTKYERPPDEDGEDD